jgi:hypothetical protein
MVQKYDMSNSSINDKLRDSLGLYIGKKARHILGNQLLVNKIYNETSGEVWAIVFLDFSLKIRREAFND